MASGVKKLLDNLADKNKVLEAEKTKMQADYEAEKSKKDDLLDKITELQRKYDGVIDQQVEVEAAWKETREKLDDCHNQSMSDDISTASPI